MMEKRVI